MIDERWLPVVGFERFYDVSDQGHVRSRLNPTRCGRRCTEYLKPWGGTKRHLRVNLCCGGKRYPRYVHHLVLEAFVGPRPPGMQGCHGKGGSRDNRLANLRWDTPTANARDLIAHGTWTNVAKKGSESDAPTSALAAVLSQIDPVHCGSAQLSLWSVDG